MDLRSELRQMKKMGTSSHHTPDKLCTVYERILEVGPEVGHIGKARLESLLACEVPQYVCIKEHPLPSFKVKIRESCLQSAVESGRRSGCFVDRWCATGAQTTGMRVDRSAPIV